MAKNKVVVLCSGGLNSAVVSSLAVREHPVAMLHVRYGHRAAQKEAELFEEQADIFGVRERLVVDMPHFATIGGNARVNRKRQIEDAMAMGDEESNCYMPGLVVGLLSAAFTWASTIGATKILVGVSEDLGPPGPKTSSIYPDYSREAVQLCNHLFGEVSPRGRISIEAPIVDLSRAEIVKIGHRLGTPFQLTWSCLSSGTEPCGACIGCATRNRGFLDAAIPDPIMLEPARQ
ncbi:MAG: 7-cyano-7-deazaguanine synthase [Phycisphaerae bacterium]|nr:7-cyano-7-deazaguanine synthase [Phycisphaerae bacterium]